MALSVFDSALALGASILWPIAHELLIVLVFSSSFFLWRHFGQRRHATKRQGKKILADSPCAARGPRCERQRSFDFAPNRNLPGDDGKPARCSEEAQAAEKQMLLHLERHEFTCALNMYRTFEREGQDVAFSENFFATFIQAAVRVGKFDVVERVLRTIKRQRMSPSAKFWQSLLRMLSSRKNYSACLAVHAQCLRLIPPDKIVYSCLINAALEVGDPERAKSMLEHYRQADLEAKDYVLFFRTYQALGDVDSATAVFLELGGRASTLMLNLLLLTCVNTRQMDRGLGILQEAHRIEGPTPQNRLVDVVSYNTIIKGLSQNKSPPQQSFDCLSTMVSKGIAPDDITWSTLLELCISSDELGAAEQIVDLLIEGNHTMGTDTCSLFIRGLVRANQIHKALELYDTMKKRNILRQDIITYSVLVKALVDQHELERAMLLVGDLNDAGLKPDDIMTTHLLEGCRHTNNYELGKKIFKELLSAGVKPSDYALVSMLKLHGRCGASAEAFTLVESWEKVNGTKPSVIHYTCVMSGCIRTKSHSLAWATYELMCANGVEPDATMLSTLLPSMVSAQNWPAVVQLAKRATSTGRSLIPAEHLNRALSQMCGSGGASADQVAELQECMRTARVAISPKHASSGGSGAGGGGFARRAGGRSGQRGPGAGGR